MADGVDTSMYARAAVKPVNPFEMMGTIANTQNAINQNLAFQQMYRGRQALGKVLQSAVGQDGQLDYNKAFVMMSANPDTAWMATDFFNQAVARQNMQAETGLKELQAAQMQQEAYGKAATSLLTLGPKVTQKDVVAKVGELYAAGLIKKPQAVGFLTNLPPDGPALQQHVKELALRAMPAAEAMAKVFGTIQTTDTGGGTQVAAVSPLMGTYNKLADVTKTPTPEQMNAQVETVVPSGPNAGAKTKTPRFMFPMVSGSGEQVPGTGGAPPGLPLAEQAPAPGTPAAAAAQPQPIGNTIPAPKSTKSVTAPAVMTSLPPSAQKYQEASAANIAKYEDQLNNTVTTSNTLLMNLEEARDTLKSFQTGGGVSVRAKLAQLAQAVGMPDELVNKISAGSIAAAQEFAKLTAQQAMQSLKQNAGTSQRFTNLEFETFSKSNPNLDTDPRAVEKVYNLLARITKVSIQEQQAFDKYKQLPNVNLATFPAWWERQLLKHGVIKPTTVSGEALGTKGK